MGTQQPNPLTPETCKELFVLLSMATRECVRGEIIEEISALTGMEPDGQEVDTTMVAVLESYRTDDIENMDDEAMGAACLDLYMAGVGTAPLIMSCLKSARSLARQEFGGRPRLPLSVMSGELRQALKILFPEASGGTYVEMPFADALEVLASLSWGLELLQNAED